MGSKLLLAGALLGLASSAFAGPAPVRVELSDSVWVDVKPQIFGEWDDLAWVFLSLRWSSAQAPVVVSPQVEFIGRSTWRASRVEEFPVPKAWKKLPNRRLLIAGFPRVDRLGVEFAPEDVDSIWIGGIRQ